MNLRSKIDYIANKWLTVGGNIILSNAKKYSQEESAWNLAYFAVPILPVYDEQNTQAYPVRYASAQNIGYRSGQNPFPTMKYSDKRLKIMKSLANFYVDLNLIPNKLNFKSTYNYSYTSLDERNAFLPFYVSETRTATNNTIC